MVLVRRRGIILEGLVVRAVVGDRGAAEVRALRSANRRILPVPGLGRFEAALEPSPGDGLRIQQVADVFAQHRDLGRAAAIIVVRIGISDYAGGDHAARQITDSVRGVIRGGIAGNQVDRPRRRRPVHRVVGVVAHGEGLRIVPHRGHGVTVVVAHHQRGAISVVRAGSVRTHSQKLDELVQQSGVVPLLLRRVVMVLVAGVVLRAVKTKRLVSILVVVKQRIGQAVHSRGSGRRLEGRLSSFIGRNRVGAEVVVKGNVLLKDNYQVLYGSRRSRRARRGENRQCASDQQRGDSGKQRHCLSGCRIRGSGRHSYSSNNGINQYSRQLSLAVVRQVYQ